MEIRSFYRASVPGLLTLLCLAGILGREVAAQSPREAVSAPAGEFKAASPKDVKRPGYPKVARRFRREGWVNLIFMVDAKGNVHEVAVTNSSGPPALEREAMTAAGGWKFEPALLNGQPVDSAQSFKLTFELPPVDDSASREFMEWFNLFEKAVAEDDRRTADLAMARLEVDNLQEDALFGMAEFLYASRWGDEAQQLAGLKRAIAAEATATYLPSEEFELALRSILPLQVKTGDFAGAMITWHTLQKLDVGSWVLAPFRKTMAEIETLRTSDKSYKVAGHLANGAWHFSLFKQRFHFYVSQGRITGIKLRCDRKFAAIAFDPKLQYSTSDAFGSCAIEVNGDPGTNFELIQS